MPGIDEVLERLINDPTFRSQLEQDPQAALSGYTLTDDDRHLLDASLDSEAVRDRAVEQRTSKSALSAMLLGLGDVAHGVGRGGGGVQTPSGGGIFNTGGGINTADLDAVAFNPQPDPPGDLPFNPAPPPPTGGGISTADLDAVAFNPQPDPPMPADLTGARSGGGGISTEGLDAVAFNPQPDPPMPADLTGQAPPDSGTPAG